MDVKTFFVEHWGDVVVGLVVALLVLLIPKVIMGLIKWVPMKMWKGIKSVGSHFLTQIKAKKEPIAAIAYVGWQLGRIAMNLAGSFMLVIGIGIFYFIDPTWKIGYHLVATIMASVVSAYFYLKASGSTAMLQAFCTSIIDPTVATKPFSIGPKEKPWLEFGGKPQASNVPAPVVPGKIIDAVASEAPPPPKVQPGDESG